MWFLQMAQLSTTCVPHTSSAPMSIPICPRRPRCDAQCLAGESVSRARAATARRKSSPQAQSATAFHWSERRVSLRIGRESKGPGARLLDFEALDGFHDRLHVGVYVHVCPTNTTHVS